jgi:N-acetylglutamate synthase-like GNAT family acetyltransferase
MPLRITEPEAPVEYVRGEFVISTDRERVNLDVVHDFLTKCYWAKGIPREVVARSIEHSLCFGVYDESPRLAKDARPFDLAQGKHGAPAQVGFARVVSDFATVAYLGDVFVLESHRGRGLSKWLMECIVQHPALRNLRRWILLTRDAHELYSKFGFTPVQVPERFMELHNPDVYQARELI